MFNNEFYKRLTNNFDNLYSNVSLDNGKWQWENLQREIMLPSDKALIDDTGLKGHTEAYAADKDLFYGDFVLAYQRLQELGIDLSASDYVSLTFEDYECAAVVDEENVDSGELGHGGMHFNVSHVVLLMMVWGIFI